MKDGALKGKMWVGEIAGGSKNRRTREREKKWTLQVFLDDVSWSYIVIWRVDIIKENGVCVPAYKGSVGRIKKTVTTYTGPSLLLLSLPSLLPPLPCFCTCCFSCMRSCLGLWALHLARLSETYGSVWHPGGCWN